MFQNVKEVLKAATALLGSMASDAEKAAAEATATDKGSDAGKAPSTPADKVVEEADASSPAANPPDQISGMIDAARTRYDDATKWTVGAFAVIGTLIFGSIPFADVGEVDVWTADGPSQLLLGLLLAALGLAVVVWSYTRALEPEDASLGELHRTMETVSSDGKWRYFLRPLKRANRDLRLILTGPDATAHLGPDVAPYPCCKDAQTANVGVAGTIAKLGEAKAAILGDELNHAATEAVRAAVAADRQVVSAILSDLRKQAAETGKAKGDASGKAQPPQATEDEARQLAQLKELIALYEARERSIASAWPTIDTGSVQARAQHTATLQTYREHRDLLLAESAIAQLRGTFRFARGLLVAGAACTLIGGVLYATAIPSDDDGEDDDPGLSADADGGLTAGPAVTVRLVEDSDTWRAIEPPSCRTTDPLEGTLLDAGDDPSPNGPFSVLISTSAECTGTLTVARDDGSFELVD